MKALFAIIILSTIFLTSCQYDSGNHIDTVSMGYIDTNEYTDYETRIVRGDSMSGIVEEGNVVIIDIDYGEINRGDIVIIDYAGNDNPLIKSIKAIPRDSFDIVDGKLYVNGKLIKNSFGNDYYFTGNQAKMIQLYVNDYDGIIPENAYLVLGNKVSGTTDSTKFGLIDKSNIKGKVVEIRK